MNTVIIILIVIASAALGALGTALFLLKKVSRAIEQLNNPPEK